MEPFLGQIQLLPYNFNPAGWMLCDGRALPIAQYQALFALLGDQFGSDMRTTFQLPDLRGKEPVPNTHYHIAVEGVFPMRE
jgi:microcystin-dependent protein